MLGHFVIISSLMSAAIQCIYTIQCLGLPRMRYIDITLYDIYIEPDDLERRIKLSQEIIEIFRKMNGLIWIFFFLFYVVFFFEGELLHFNVIVSYTRTQCCVFEYIVLFQVNKIIQADVLKSKRNNKFVCFFLYSSLWFCWAIGEPAKKLKKKRCDKSNCLKFVLP